MFRIFVVVILLMAGSMFVVESIQDSGIVTTAKNKTPPKKQVAQKPATPGRVAITSTLGGHM